MMNLTPIVRMKLGADARRSLKRAMRPEATQRAMLQWLLANGKKTQWGKEHGLEQASGYEEFAACVPEGQEYQSFRPWIMRMVQGEKDVLWPGVCRRFAQSSGTSDGKSKYVPVTADSLRFNHYAGASRSVGFYLSAYPDSRIFTGKGFILGGSYANEVEGLPANVKVGDLSANLIDCAGKFVEFFRVPGKDVALMEDWRQKLPALVEASAKENVTNISGVPSWFLTVLKEVAASKGARTIHEVWPSLEVFFHGGIAFGPYREEYAAIAPGLRYWENYNASEGFFACSSAPGQKGMLLLPDVGVFYEFKEKGKKAVPMWEVEAGKTYDLLVSSCNGLWRYNIGDTVRIESVDPVVISIAGRNKSYINAFGEELMVHNADAAIEHACRATRSTIANYTAAPVYTHGASKGHHQWLIEWGTAPQHVEEFAQALDQALQNENSDYQAKRQGDIFLAAPAITSAPSGFFDRWLASTGKLGGQRKVPRLSPDRALMDSMLALLNEK